MAVIETRDLTKWYGDVRGVEALSFSVTEGEVFGYLGPNGAGKTTTIRTLLGLVRPTSGTATVLGADVRDATALREARRRIGYLPAVPGLDESATGRDLLDLHGGLKGDTRSDELVDTFDVRLGRPVGDLSRGNRQKLAVVMAFMHEPDLVVMDEPTSGLDPLMQERFYEFLDVEQARGVTLFVSSHVLGEVRRVCDRVGILRDGRFVTVESVEDLVGRAGKRVSVRVDGAVDPSDFAFEGVHDLSVGDVTTFTLAGGYDDLVDALNRYTVIDLEVEEAPLEEVFVRFYGTRSSAEVDRLNGTAETVDRDDVAETNGGSP